MKKWAEISVFLLSIYIVKIAPNPSMKSLVITIEYSVKLTAPFSILYMVLVLNEIPTTFLNLNLILLHPNLLVNRRSSIVSSNSECYLPVVDFMRPSGVI